MAHRERVALDPVLDAIGPCDDDRVEPVTSVRPGDRVAEPDAYAMPGQVNRVARALDELVRVLRER